MMHETVSTMERRQRRSNVPGEATQFFLEHLARELGCEAITLSSQDGLLVGGVGEGYDHDLLGALASLGSQIGSYEPDANQAARGQALRFYGFEMNGHAMYVSCVGGGPLPIEHCAATMRRIFTQKMAA
ncbi:MAG: hypothetical protein MUF64_13435 [Polyangiaceae bacterium]|jgi:hypothetical protein|nr:hypothetical protein [Polyangiaceae bacterium]